ncbi:MAG: glycoside hydrolase family 127 protein, partial [Lentisphaeria bacterium]|nr:glycoside hydrolase family 127 protein [Lentisphaeria bacterium]
MTKAMKHCLCISAAIASSIPFTFGAPPAVPFKLNEVELLESPFLANKKRNADFLLTLSPDRLMARMYEYCGETPKAPVYGGWESSDLSGHTLGHYLTALSLEYATTGDTRFKERVDYIIGEMARCQKLYGESGYIGCMSRNARRALEALKDGDVETINRTWAPWYTQHKIAEGLYDAWKVAGNEQAKDVLVNFARWVDGLTKGLDEKKCQRMLDMEFGGMGEVFWKLYAETKDETHKALAQRFRHHWLVDDLAAGKDNLAGKHANTQ